MERDYLIAGLRVRMDTFGRTEALAQPYCALHGGEPDIHICSQQEYCRAHRPDAPLDELEYMGTSRDFYTQLLQHDGMALHASAILVDGRAWLFSADSGVGKSTHRALWQQVLGEDRVLIINDDKPALRRLDGQWYAYGTPWCGKEGLNRNLWAPVGGLCLLERGDTNAIAPYTADDLLFRLLRQTQPVQACDALNHLLTLMDTLTKEVPIWRLRCTPTPEAALLAYRHMTGKANE
ncbi:MAG: hypothetical protein IJE07_02365 [Clostridia bacterium]|nr:hypothetical protein [Clostridia bacterium]